MSNQPYQAYGGERVAGFSPLQQQAMANVASPEAFGKQVQGYMSPYMQNVVDIQKREPGGRLAFWVRNKQVRLPAQVHLAVTVKAFSPPSGNAT